LERTMEGVMALLNFGSVTLVYPGGDRVEMLNGQLMGCPLSFPLLCLANLSTLLRMNDSGVLATAVINGDDVLFGANPEIFRQWIKNTEDIGLFRSPGKNYLTADHCGRRCFQVNSRLYQLGVAPKSEWMFEDYLEDPVFVPRKCVRIGYSNYALSIGHRVKSVPTVTLGTVPSIIERLSEFVSERSSRLLTDLFLASNSKLLRVSRKIGTEIFTPNWRIPKHLGGLGLVVDRPLFFSRIQRKVASYLSRNPLEAWLSEKLQDLPLGARKALRDFKRISSAFVPRTEGPLEFERTLDYAEKLLNQCMSHRAWERSPDQVQWGPGERHLPDRNMPETCPSVSSRILVRGKQIINQPLMSVKKMLEWRFDYMLEESLSPKYVAQIKDEPSDESRRILNEMYRLFILDI